MITDLAGYEPDALGQLPPDLLPEGSPRVLLDRVVHNLREVLMGPVPTSEADQGEAGGQQPRLARS